MKLLILVLFFVLALTASAKTVHYELTATREKINLSGKKEVDFALLLNGSIPAPTLEFTEGDIAEIVVRNALKKEEVSIHWHGILLPPIMDGVPYVNTPPIGPGESFTFKFPLRQHGTYWYHSHTGLQEQKGLYGAFIIHPKERTIKADKELVLVVSDWTDENPDQVLRNLRKDGEFYVFKKGTMRSWLGAIKQGSLKDLLFNEWARMGGMDLSDVGYDAFLINGKRDHQALMAHPGDKIRIRIINAAASTYFYLSLGDAPLQVISADGVDIRPAHAREVLMGMAETYDILFEVPEHKNYEFKAAAQDGTGSASAWIGTGEKVHAPKRPMPDLYARMEHGEHQAHDHHHMPSTMPLLTVGNMMAQTSTELPHHAPKHSVTLELDGDMERYIWLINNRAIHEDRSLKINEGEVVRFTFKNNTMMHHPFHLHGHFFRVLNEHGERSPLKHTVDVPPHGSRTIEFYANEPGEWMLHCHNLYHLKTGMARVVSYRGFQRPQVMDQYINMDPHLMDHVYYRGMVEAANIHAQLQFDLIRTWDELELRAEARDEDDWNPEGDLLYKRWLNRFTYAAAGGTLLDGEAAVLAGVGQLLPMLIESQLLVDQKARLRLDLEKRFQWTRYIYTDAEFTFRQEQESELEVTLMYQKDWSWSAGLMFTEHRAGAGLQYRF